jgi:prepilin-type N-terminal cleavage/methylation domain-containing protein
VRRCTRLAAATGFTLVELLVVIAIIGTLVALLLPAVQMAREAARRASCVNNLRQIGAAIHMYHDATTFFPPGGVSPGPCCSVESYTCWTIQILPFLEQKALYDQYNQLATNESKANKTVRETFLAVYSCPSDLLPKTMTRPDSGPGHDFNLNYMPGSYRGMGGRSDGVTGWWDNYPGYTNLPKRWRGVFHVVDAVGDTAPGGASKRRYLGVETFSAVRDGLSNTIMVGEYSTRPSKAIAISSGGMSRRTFWAYTYGSYNRSDAVPESRTLLGDYDRCTSIGGQGDIAPCNRAWGSFHPDVNNFLLCDGSVQTFSITMDMNRFVEMATIAGRDNATLP